MTTRSVLGLILTLQGLERMGFSSGKALKRHGLSLDDISPDAEIDRGQELQILADVLDTVDDPLAGLRVGSGFSLAGYGSLTMLLMTCNSVYHAFQTGIRYQQLGYLYGELYLEPGEPNSSICIRPLVLPESVRRFIIDRDASGTYQLIRDLGTNLGIRANATVVSLPYPAPPEAAAYEQRFGCPVRFGGDLTRFTLSNDILSTPFPSANRTAHNLYVSQCDQLLARRETQTDNLAGRVHGQLSLFAGDFPSAPEVARSMGMSERSLRRQLGEEKTSFRQILEGVKFDRARQLLANSTLSVEAIAQRLGYSESAAFVHAFQRWAGSSPAAWRKGQAIAGKKSQPHT